MAKIPVTIITGFLGAGKTTFINNLLTNPGDRRVAIIVNEFGDIGIDDQMVLDIEEDVYLLNNGCMCCTLRSDISTTLRAIMQVNENAKEGTDVTHVFVETTGLADPAPIAQTFLRDEFLVHNFTLDSILTLVDCQNAIYQLKHYDEAAEQISFADTIIYSKRDLVSDTIFEMIDEAVAELNPFATRLVGGLDGIAADNFIDKKAYNLRDENVDDFIAKQAAKHEHSHHHDHDHDHEHHHDHDHEHHDHDHDHDHDHEHHDHDHDHDHLHIDNYNSVSLYVEEALDLNAIQRWLNELIYVFGTDLMRYKGILNIENVDQQVIFQGVNMHFETSLGKTWGDQKRVSTMVFIGKKLPKKMLTETFEKTVTKK